MAERLVGSNYTTPDLVAKVTGRARYAEDFRAEGMLFCKLLSSPMPHARVRRIDASRALALPGVRGLITADDLPDLGGAERALTNEPLYQGEPILALAAVSEDIAAEAIELIDVEFEPLPFTVDPLESLRPDGPDARLEGNVWGVAPPPAAGQPPGRPPIERLKWTAADFAAAPDGQLPMGEPKEQWSYGDLDRGFADAALVLDETFVVNATGHHPMETRSAMAYWRGDTVYLHCSTQSVVRTVEPVARWVGIDPAKVVLICEYTGGGFGSKGAGAVSMAIPAVLSKKVGAPVMMRVSREEESYFGRARTNMTGRAEIGFEKDGRIRAMDIYVVQDNGPYGPMGDWRSGALSASLVYQPLAMRVRVANVFTNTPPRTQQRSPGPMQFNGIVEGVLTKAAKQLGVDQVALRRINAPEGKATYGPANAEGQRRYVTGAFVKDALDRGAELFDWQARLARSGQRRGTKARGMALPLVPTAPGRSVSTA